MDLPRLRLAAQRLLGSPHDSPEGVVQSLLAVQAQDFLGATWAVAQRTQRGLGSSVDEAYQAGRILRTHVLRPTWHFVAPSDLRWLLALTAPRIHAQSASYYKKAGLDDAAAKQSATRIARALSAGRHLTRAELARAIDPKDKALSGNRLAWFIMRAELDGLIVSGKMRGKQHTYALLEERAPAATALSREDALTRIAIGYVSGHGPAQAEDLAWWAGLTKSDAERGLAGARGVLEPLRLGEQRYWALPGSRRAPAGPRVHLLPSYDELIVAFKDRSAMIDPGIDPSTELLLGQAIVSGGRVIGSWTRTLRAKEVVISAQLLRPLSTAESEGLAAAAARYGHSLGLSKLLEIVYAERRQRRRSPSSAKSPKASSARAPR